MLNLRPGAIKPAYVPEVTPTREDYGDYESDGPEAMEREVQELVYGLVRALKPQLVVEVGTHEGSTAEVIGNALEDNQRGQLITIEIDHLLVRKARNRCQHLQRVEVVCADAMAVASGYHLVPLDGQLRELDGIDFLIVDGGEGRAREHEAFEPLLASGAIVIRHDAHRHGHGNLDGYDTIVLRTPRGLAISQRRS